MANRNSTSRRTAEIVTHMVDVCHRLYRNRYVAATDGNVSIRLDNRHFLTTRTSVNKGTVMPEDLVEVDGRGLPTAGKCRPSTEFGMHLFIYNRRPDVNAVVHAHPPYATAFATAGMDLGDAVFPEVLVALGKVPLALYATPSTPEVAASIAPFVENATVILLGNHGVVAYGSDLYDAYFKLEKTEHTAQILFLSRMLGGEHALSGENIEKLRTVSLRVYGKKIPAGIVLPMRKNAGGRRGRRR